MQYKDSFKIADKEISIHGSVYFIADIASSHDGDLGRAKNLIWSAKTAGADCVKFQHFKAKDIVSDHGFRSLSRQASHQANWKKSVFEVFKQYELNREWNEILAAEAKTAGVHFMTTPYDFEAVEQINDLVPAYKIGSGDITWRQLLEHVASKQKPVILASGASNIDEVISAVNAISKINPELALLQCNTNYTGSLENFKFINLNVLKTFSVAFPNLPLGLSDHTPGHSTVLGAIALGARIIEKHYTDDNFREGPDHAFSMNPASWQEMVDRSRELKYALGDGVKRVEGNEIETAVLQRRCVRAKYSLEKGAKISNENTVALRPCPSKGVPPNMINLLIGKTLSREMAEGELIDLSHVE